MDLINKTILITGANGSLGQAVSKRASRYGASVIMFDIAFSEEENDDEEKVLRKKANLLDANDISEQLAEFSQIDVVFNLAGGFNMGSTVWETSEKDWDFLFDINVKTVRNVVNVIVPKMLDQNKGGAIINVGAYAAHRGVAAMGAYCASKSVVMRLTESLSAELKTERINVNAILPSVIDTPANRAAMPEVDPATWVSPDDLAEVLCFLASDGARAIHGALIPVTGLS